jgi:hypothetical protein
VSKKGDFLGIYRGLKKGDFNGIDWESQGNSAYGKSGDFTMKKVIEWEYHENIPFGYLT